MVRSTDARCDAARPQIRGGRGAPSARPPYLGNGALGQWEVLKLRLQRVPHLLEGENLGRHNVAALE